MPRVEIEDDMKASAKTIYYILINDELESKWNLTVNELKSIGPKKWEVKSIIGDLVSTRIEEVENEKIYCRISEEGGEPEDFDKKTLIVAP